MSQTTRLAMLPTASFYKRRLATAPPGTLYISVTADIAAATLAYRSRGSPNKVVVCQGKMTAFLREADSVVNRAVTALLEV